MHMQQYALTNFTLINYKDEHLLSYLCLGKMSINISSDFAKIFHVAIWRVNILIDLLIFNSPFSSSSSISLINYFKDELKDLIVLINISTKELISVFFVQFINFFNTFMTCVYLAICCEL